MLSDFPRKVAVDLRAVLLPAVYGVFAGLAAVAFAFEPESCMAERFPRSGGSKPLETNYG